MKAGLVQQQSQTMRLTKELTQAIEILQYTAGELQEFLKKQALENPLMDVKDYKIYNRKTSSNWESYVTKPQSLYDELRQQLYDLHINDVCKEIVEYLIEELDRDGYLRTSEKQLCKRLRVNEEELGKAIVTLQSFEPAGVGARTLNECLMLQLQRKQLLVPTLKELLTTYFDLYVKKQWHELSKRLNIELSVIQNIHDVIKKLDPRPGLQFETASPYIIPDLYIEKAEDGLHVTLNDMLTPRITLNKELYEQYKQVEDTHTRQFVSTCVKRYRWLTYSLQQRHEMMVSVMLEILQQQPYFIDEGFERLKPLTMSMVANKLGVHESTISRTVRGKYVQTPFGTIELRKFFSNAVPGLRDDVSSQQVKHLLTQLIEKENKQKPMSDANLVKELKNRYDITVSRRTIAKYRDSLRIPAAYMRRQF
ncbi:RNA polymerase sigma-54 factor [Bacillus sp. HMF5848]|uniref:RNA polymerase factor sigma-54 n=1 Tax=Bacillus sp. HMF5848 TaxID=2495421 RepID=UPI000F7B96ED|nr:RNA polymerase factor sigma-54 [Bacillus sp. HMF5848]RSK28539.1 RNA polymerase sigma-54 factor [Bacillus sp. HMF5848]